MEIFGCSAFVFVFAFGVSVEYRIE